MSFKYQRNGTRRVILLGKYAFKFPNFFSWQGFLTGLLANMHEKTFDIMKMPEVLPVLFSCPGGWLNIMPRAEVKFTQEYLDLFEEMLLTSNNAIVIRNIVELKPDSIGKFNGRIVAIDYGH